MPTGIALSGLRDRAVAGFGEEAVGTRGVVVVVAAAIMVGSVSARGGSGGANADPLGDFDGTRRGMALVTGETDRQVALRTIEKLRVAPRGSRSGYRRDRFGENWSDAATGVAYAGNGCRTRDDMLARDGENVRLRKGSRCVVISMTLRDPYTGRLVQWTKKRHDEIQVDHIVPLSYSWRMGASRWPARKRLRFANDPLNLLPVYGPANEEKGGSGPAAWLPPQRSVRCGYVARFAQVAVKYDLPVTRADRAVMRSQCR
jgi:hypothetical protein